MYAEKAAKRGYAGMSEGRMGGGGGVETKKPHASRGRHSQRP